MCAIDSVYAESPITLAWRSEFASQPSEDKVHTKNLQINTGSRWLGWEAEKTVTKNRPSGDLSFASINQRFVYGNGGRESEFQKIKNFAANLNFKF